MVYTLYVIVNSNRQFLTDGNTWVDFFDLARFYTNPVMAHAKAAAVCGTVKLVTAMLED